MPQDIITPQAGMRGYIRTADSELSALLTGVPTAAVADAGALTATALAAAIPAAAPAGGTGATAGAYDTAGNRDLMITTVNGLRTWALEVDTDYEAILVDVAAIRTKLNALLAALRTAGIVTP